MFKKLAIIIAFFIVTLNAFSQGIQIRNIYIDNKRVFEPEDKDWFFGSEFLNFFHHTTQLYVIEDELLFDQNSVTDEEYIYETERSLRNSGFFAYSKIELDSLGYDNYDAYIVTKDRWSLYPSIPFGTGGGEYKYGAKLEEFNFIGTGTSIKLEALNRTENDIGWQGEFSISNRRLFRSPFFAQLALIANKIKTQQQLDIYKPYYNLDTRYSYGAFIKNDFGSNFIYRFDSTFNLVPFEEQSLKMYFSRAWFRNDRIFANLSIELNNVNRGEENLKFAYDNSGKILLMFSSLSQKFYPVSKINYYHTEDMAIGGYGSATLGKIFPMGSKDGNNSYYVGGQGEISYFDGRLYLFGQLTGASSFKSSQGQFTYQEFLGLSFLRFSNSLLLAARIDQQTVWNWNSYRQLLLDNDRGLRGYNLNQINGDNRIISNIELRYFPDWTVWVLKLSGVLFADLGTVWDQDQKLFKSRLYSSIGAGIRLHFTKSANPKQTLRIDFAYNTSEKKFGGIIITTQQLFSAFGNHEYKIPAVFGTTNDLE